MIQKISGVEQVGIYSVAYSIGNAINIISNSINQTITPWLYRKLKDNDYKEIRKNITYIFLIVLLIISVFILIVPEMLNIIAAKEYKEALDVVRPVAASTFFSFVYGLFATIEFYFDKNKFSMIISGISAITNILLNLVFINLFDYRAAGYTTMVCYALLAIGHLIYTNKILEKNKKGYLIRNITMISIILLMYGIVIVSQMLNEFAYIRYLIIAFIFILAFFNRKVIIRKLNNFS